MKKIKSVLCMVIAVAMAVSLCGCFMWGGDSPYPKTTEKPAKTEKPDDTQSAEATATAEITEDNTPAPTAETTPEVQPTPEAQSAADEAFAALDLELFTGMVTSSYDNYNQCIACDPAMFGIDPADVTKGWGDYYTEDGNAEYMEYCRGVLESLDAIDRDELNDRNKLAYDAIRRTFEVELMFEDYYYYDEPLTPMNGYHTALPLTMVCLSIRNLDDVENYVYMLEDMPRVIDQIAAFEQGKADHGQFMTVTAMEQVVESCEDFAGTGSDCFLISYFDTVAEKARELGMSDAEISALRERNDDAILNGILPAYQRLADTLKRNRSKCSELRGAADIGGKQKDYFDLSVQKEAGTLEDIDELIEMLEDMGDDILMEMITTMYTDPDAFSSYGDPVTFGSVEQDMDWLSDFTAKYYPNMPDHDVEFVIIPEDIAEDFSPAAYLTPSFDDYYDNLILLNPTSEDETQLFTLAHEGAPGHMYQFLYFRNMQGLSLTQQLLEPTGCAEGWTVFTEYFVANNCADIGTGLCMLMNTESVYGNIFLPAYISLQVNHNGWEAEDVEEYLGALGMGDYADLLFEYAVTMPTYAMSYAIGFTYMYDLYNDQSLSTPQQHKAYFEKLLSFGPMYLDMLVENFKG